MSTKKFSDNATEIIIHFLFKSKTLTLPLEGRNSGRWWPLTSTYCQRSGMRGVLPPRSFVRLHDMAHIKHVNFNSIMIILMLSHYHHANDKVERKFRVTHSWPRHYMGMSGQRHVPAALYPQGKDPRYPLYRRLVGPQSRSGHRG
jgi:hypothetical protein